MDNNYLFRAFAPIFIGGVLILTAHHVLFDTNMIEQPIKYCTGHLGVKTTMAGIANLSHRFVCTDGTTEEDRGETGMVPDPKSTPLFKLP